MLFTAKNSTLAVDLSLEAVRLVTVRRRHGQIQIEDLVTQTVPEGPAETLPERHLTILGQMIKPLRLQSSRIIASLPTNLIITRAMKLDVGNPQTVRERIVWTLQNCIPFNPQDLVYDYWPVGSPDAKGQEIIVTASQGSVINRYLRGFETLKLQCLHLDVAPCAVGTLLKYYGQSGPICTLVLNGSQGYFAIVEDGKVLFWRPFDVNATPDAQEELAPATLERMSEEIARCFTHVAGSMPLDKISHMLLFGRWSNDQKLNQYLANHFHVPTDNPSPLTVLGPNGLSPAAQQTTAFTQPTDYATAIGLALQFSGGTYHG